jgi:hypothetical protein
MPAATYCRGRYSIAPAKVSQDLSGAVITFEAIERLIGCATGEFRKACPICGPSRSTPQKRKLQVLKIWHERPDFASFACAHCEASGYVVRNGAAKVSREDHVRLRAQANAAAKESDGERIARARSLWSRRLPIAGTVVETYLRRARCRRPAISQKIDLISNFAGALGRSRGAAGVQRGA